uniref:CCHC-type domain-containing protein n=1 Tax=Strigamia maritima TaxID=126957 RepID=T1IM60_STRMM
MAEIEAVIKKITDKAVTTLDELMLLRVKEELKPLLALRQEAGAPIGGEADDNDPDDQQQQSVAESTESGAERAVQLQIAQMQLENARRETKTAPKLPCFSGERRQLRTTSEWLQIVEDYANDYKWTNTTKLVNAAAAFDGAAKIWQENTGEMKRRYGTWASYLRRDFPDQEMTLAEKQALMQAPQKTDEAVEAYIYRKWAVCSRLKLDLCEAREYIVDGLTNKSVMGPVYLNQYTSIGDVIRNVKMMEAKFVGEKNEVKLEVRPKAVVNKEKPYVKGVEKFFKCTEMGHRARNCPNPNATPKCFVCKKEGHMASVCPAVQCYNCQGIGHYAAACTEPKRARTTDVKKDAEKSAKSAACKQVVAAGEWASEPMTPKFQVAMLKPLWTYFVLW